MTRSNNAEVFDENSASRPGDGPADSTVKSKPNRVRLRLARRALDNAKGYLGRGWQPVPVPLEEKGPKQKDWQNLAITPANAADYFEQNQNIGLQLGARSGGLTDVDIDCPEALALADTFLPATSAIFGRASKPRSHWLYITDLHGSEKKAVIRNVEPPSPRNGRQASTLIDCAWAATRKRKRLASNLYTLQAKVCVGITTANLGRLMGRFLEKPLLKWQSQRSLSATIQAQAAATKPRWFWAVYWRVAAPPQKRSRDLFRPSLSMPATKRRTNAVGRRRAQLTCWCAAILHQD